MARSKSATLTEAELRIMNVLWDKGPATVHEVLQALPEKPSLAYNSVLTIIRILETKGYVKHVKDKRAHIYMPKIEREDATRFEVRHLISRFFGNSHERLLLNISFYGHCKLSLWSVVCSLWSVFLFEDI